MSNMSTAFGVTRVVILGTVSLFSAIVLIMSALITSAVPYVFSVLGIAVACLTLITVPTMLALSLTRKGAFPSMIIVEIAYTSVLTVLWLGTAATVGNLLSAVSYCITVGCMIAQAIAAFAFLNWLLLMAHVIFLLTLAAIQSGRGNPIWTKCVTDVDYSAQPSHTPGPVMMADGKSPYSAASTTLPSSPQPYVSPQQYPPQQGYPVQQPYPVQQQQQQQPYPVQQPYQQPQHPTTPQV